MGTLLLKEIATTASGLEHGWKIIITSNGMCKYLSRPNCGVGKGRRMVLIYSWTLICKSTMAKTNLPQIRKSNLMKMKRFTWWRHQMETFSALLAISAGNSQPPVNSLNKGQWRGALMFSWICVWINSWVNNGEAGDLRRYRTHYGVTVM